MWICTIAIALKYIRIDHNGLKANQIFRLKASNNFVAHSATISFVYNSFEMNFNLNWMQLILSSRKCIERRRFKYERMFGSGCSECVQVFGVCLRVRVLPLLKCVGAFLRLHVDVDCPFDCNRQNFCILGKKVGAIIFIHNISDLGHEEHKFRVPVKCIRRDATGTLKIIKLSEMIRWRKSWILILLLPKPNNK